MAITIWNRPLRWAAAWACALCALAGCGGGGGGGDDAISGTFQLDGLAELGVVGSVRAELPQGVEGTPRCSLVSGSVPPGMVFGTDCSLAGTPSQIGVFTSQLNFTVSGRPGSATVNVQMVVGGPVLQQTGPLTETLRLLVALPPSDVVGVFGQAQYSQLAGDVITYAVASGSLPTGLTLDPATGKLSGTPVALGNFEAMVGATLRRNGQDYPLNTVQVAKTVLAPFGNITYDANCCDLNYGVVPMQTPAPVFFPALPAGATARFESTAALPAGLALDPATGIISGRTAMPGTYPVGMRANVTTAEGVVFPLDMTANFWRLNIQGVLPRYDGNTNCGSRQVFDPFETVPSQLQFNVFRLSVCTMSPGTVFAGQAGDVYHYALIAHPGTGAAPPSWVSVDADSGVVSVTAPESAPGQGTPVTFGLQVTTTRGADVIATRQGWTLLVQ
jgi:Putative Ig domain